MSTGSKFERAVQIMHRLRAPGGCPWDREQTFDSIKPFTLEETYEVLEAIDNRDWHELTGELGDLLLQVLFYAEMAQEAGHFTIDDVLERLSSKLVDRHPHVFGDVKAETAGEVLRNWEALKAEEKKKRLEAGGGKKSQVETGDGSPQQGKSGLAGGPDSPSPSVLEGVSPAMPALLEAHKLSSRAAHVGFEWPEIEGLFDKLAEETRELREELRAYPGGTAADETPALRIPPPAGRGVAGARGVKVPDELRSRLEGEVGDLLFVLVNVARYLSLDPESALKKTNRKFKQRFQWMEQQLRSSGRGPADATLDELESLWQQSKQREQHPPAEASR
jgi:MazG family protein